MIPFRPLHPIDAALDAKVEADVQLGRLQDICDALFDKRPCDVDWSDAELLQRLARGIRELRDALEAEGAVGKQ